MTVTLFDKKIREILHIFLLHVFYQEHRLLKNICLYFALAFHLRLSRVVLQFTVYKISYFFLKLFCSSQRICRFLGMQKLHQTPTQMQKCGKSAVIRLSDFFHGMHHPLPLPPASHSLQTFRGGGGGEG